MRITYFYRSLKSGYSIKRVFQTITKELGKHLNIEEVFLPENKSNFYSIFRNGIFAIGFQDRKVINHITGSEHYLLYFLNPNRTIITVHDIMYFSYLSGLKRLIWKLLYIYPLKRARMVIFISDLAKREVIDQINLPANKVVIIPDPVSEDFQYSPKIFNKEEPVILHIGTLERKNLERTIVALNGIKCHLRIVGKLSSQMEELLITNNIKYSNVFNLTDEQIVNEYLNCDIVNFPSVYEGFGVPVIEGQKTGRVVLTSNISPMKEVAGDGAFLVDPFSVTSIREGYSRIIEDDRLRMDLIQKGLMNVRRFSVENVAKQYMDLYKDTFSI